MSLIRASLLTFAMIIAGLATAEVRRPTPPWYDVTYTEVAGGNHAPHWWRPRLAEGIVLLSADLPR